MDKRSKPQNSNKSDGLDKNVLKPYYNVSLSAFAFIFSEIIQYSLSNVRQGYQLEERLHEMGVRVGYRVLDLMSLREKSSGRETRILNILTLVAQSCWKYMFGHTAELLKGQENDGEYYLSDKSLLLNKYIVVPRDLGHVNCGAYAAGIVEGILCSAEFPAEVSAHTVEESPNSTSTTLLIRFMNEVVQRDKLGTGRQQR